MRPLIVLGASVRAAAFSAIRAGFAPQAIDVFADRDLAAICDAIKIARYPGEFLTALAAAPDAPWIYTGGLENHPRLVDRLAEIRPLLGNRGSTLRRVRDPLRLAQAVEVAGLPFPKTALSRANPKDNERWLVKPRRSGGGLGIRFATAEDAQHPPRGTYIQQHIAGEAASAVFVVADGQAKLLGVTRQLLGQDFSLDRPFLYVGSLGPLPLSGTERSNVESLGAVLAREFHLAGLFNVDFVRTSDGIWPVEVNPRYSASVEVLERTTGTDCIALHVAACGGADVSAASAGGTPAPQSSGKAIVYAVPDAIISPRFDALVEDWNQPGMPSGIADLPRVGEAIRAGQPVATVFAQGESLASVETELRRRLAAVHATL
jgi:predicted ATP-grasp superfamily ATP-dependent carboligase